MPLYVMSGRFKGRRLASPAGRDIRPSSGRMRIAVMNILGHAAVSGASVLDLYAGTGASGMEALSCGARRVLFVEQARPALAALERNIEALGLGREEVRVLRSDTARALGGRLPLEFAPFDIVFCDPPYEVYRSAASAHSLRVGLGSVVGRGAFSPGGTLVVEHPAAVGFGAPPAGLVEVDRRRYSAAGVSFFRLRPSATTGISAAS